MAIKVLVQSVNLNAQIRDSLSKRIGLKAGINIGKIPSWQLTLIGISQWG
jgi:hypothetical protein